MALYETKVNMTLRRDNVSLLTGETIELDSGRADNINKELETAFPTLSPVLVLVGASTTAEEVAEEAEDVEEDHNKQTKEEIKAELDAKGIEYPKGATKAELLELL